MLMTTLGLSALIKFAFIGTGIFLASFSQLRRVSIQCAFATKHQQMSTGVKKKKLV